MTTQHKDNLAEALDAQFAEAWRPEAGESLIGTVAAISQRDAGYGSYPIVTIQPDEGEPKALHAIHAVAQAQLAESRPGIGERIGVRYLGKVDGAERAYHSYKVVVDRPEQDVDWSQYGGDDSSDEGDAGSATTGVHEPLDGGQAAEAAADDIPF